ncbi:MAG: UDP-N-acetylmuramate dehydrogenase [Ardenticatenia bacterium]|nr:UDP-N-acetylmuramate dehydrogenase [Ardenticatenia bacterium]
MSTPRRGRWASRDSLRRSDLVRIILRGAFGDRILTDEPLAPYTSFRIGGPAQWFLKAESVEELREAVRVAQRAHIPYLVLGRGSNVLVSDDGVDGLVILNRTRRFTVRPASAGLLLVADSGVSLPKLAGKLAQGGVSGLEWAIGIPGSVGGAVVQNAGAWGHEIKDRLVSVEWLTPDGQIEEVPAQRLELDYRRSALLDVPPGKRPIILRAKFQVDRGKPTEVQRRLRCYIMRRTTSQPRAPSGGSVFRNPPGDYAGRLIEAVGLKGHRIGNAQFSPKHANFIINLGGATAEDVRALIDLARRRVRDAFGITLELEIELVGRWEEEDESQAQDHTPPAQGQEGEDGP